MASVPEASGIGEGLDGQRVAAAIDLDLLQDGDGLDDLGDGLRARSGSLSLVEVVVMMLMAVEVLVVAVVVFMLVFMLVLAMSIVVLGQKE